MAVRGFGRASRRDVARSRSSTWWRATHTSGCSHRRSKLDVTLRGAVSLARRLQDSLAELVKIDPKSIGVGQYQHDVDQRRLKKRLGDIVVSAVNRVGVEVNTASVALVASVSGIGPMLAASIVKTRDE